MSELFNEALLKHWGEREPWTDPQTGSPRPPPPRVRSLIAKARALADELLKAADAIEAWRFEGEEVDDFEERVEKAFAAAYGIHARGDREELSALFARDLIRAIWKVIEIRSIASPKLADAFKTDYSAMAKGLLLDRHPNAKDLDLGLLEEAIRLFSKKPGRGDRRWATVRALMQNLDMKPLGDERLKQIAALAKTAKARKLGER